MAERGEHTTMLKCAEPTCNKERPDHQWGSRGPYSGWFTERWSETNPDPKTWCPDHHPEWVAEWRAKRAAQRARPDS